MTNTQTKRLILASVALVALLFVPIESKADQVGICNPDGPGQCSASVSLTGNTFTIVLTNTSPVANGGFITAAAFNLTAGTVVSNFTTTNANFALFGPAPTGWTGSVAPDGTRTHLISATGNDYLGGGDPTGGVPVNGSVTFTVTLSSLNGNTEESIFNSLLVRERGFVDDGSDKDELQPIPEPTTMLLLGTGLMGLGAGIRRWRRK